MNEKEIRELLKNYFKQNPELNSRMSRKDLDEVEDMATYAAIKMIHRSFEKARKRRFPITTERLCGYIIDTIVEMEEEGEI